MPIFIKLKCQDCERTIEYVPNDIAIGWLISELIVTETDKDGQAVKNGLKGVARIPLPSDWVTWSSGEKQDVCCPWCDARRVKEREKEEDDEEDEG